MEMTFLCVDSKLFEFLLLFLFGKFTEEEKRQIRIYKKTKLNRLYRFDNILKSKTIRSIQNKCEISTKILRGEQ
jgi:hypothetical protein